MIDGGQETTFGPGLYIHVPFCLSKCGYCAFYSTLPTHDLVTAYLARLEDELRTEIDGRIRPRMRTVFIGGGNPTSVGPGHFEKLIRIVSRAIAGAPVDEWTVETNPETLSGEIAAVLRDIPGLRLSMGLQRLRDDELRLLGRQGTLSSGREALARALSLTGRVGVDLILGLPDRPSLAPGLADLVREFPLEHVSAYFLTVEEGTPLAARVDEGGFPDPADVGPGELFEVADALAAAGYEQYEISNFARPGGRCRHNMNYWNGGEYVGAGPSAVGTRAGVRRTKPSPLKQWLSGAPDAVETLSEVDRFHETVMLRLRLVGDGLDLEALARAFGKLPRGFETAIDRQCEAGALIRKGNVVSLSRQGIALANRVIADLF
ncbi:MAG TPA: coproporphyrinogen-III oxidase family protein [Candidatus Ozemobacteraceae bacterium]|nr:coproporphyrinogen-III oxidase family protein [Candidatus Ozemobacteraceae bacterium]HQG27400.1 coproporphyrinogen-III oxidase family protein [Candidatus Ozemobacteraceae bacterium]